MYIAVKGADDSSIVSSVIKNFESAKTKRELMVELYEECFEYTLPYRESFHQVKEEMIRYLMRLL